MTRALREWWAEMPHESGARRWLLWLVVANIAAGVLHYADNVMFFSAYPEPAWATPHIVDAFWFVMTPFAVAGYFLVRRGFVVWGSVMLYLYAGMSLLVLGHYLYAPPGSVHFRINLFIILEVVLAAVLIAYVSSVRFGIFGRCAVESPRERRSS
jgi:hypothetical protein